MYDDTPEQQIRREQTNFARSTLGLPPGKKPFVHHKGPKMNKPKTSKPQGHEGLLKALEVSGGVVEVLFLDDDETMTGRVRHSDKFTISVQEDDDSDTVVLFKHALRGFKVKTPPPSFKEASPAGDQ